MERPSDEAKVGRVQEIGDTHANFPELWLYTGWWFGTLGLLFHSVGNFIIPIDELIFFRGVGIPPTSIYFPIYPLKCGRSTFSHRRFRLVLIEKIRM